MRRREGRGLGEVLCVVCDTRRQREAQRRMQRGRDRQMNAPDTGIQRDREPDRG